MRRKRITRQQFMIVACLIATVSLSMGHIVDLEREQGELREVIQVLTTEYDEKQDMAKQLKDYHEQVKALRQRNNSLEEILFNRASSYLVVTEGLTSAGTGAPLLTRSALETEEVMITALNMPVRSKSGFNEADFEEVWRTYGATPLKGMGEVFVQAEEEYGINALVLAAIIAHESSWGKSVIAAHKNNLAGLGAYDGSAYSSAMTFASKADSVFFLAELLNRDYTTPGGRHYNGPGLLGIGKAYASDPRWAQKVAAKMRQLVLAAVDDPEVILKYARDGPPLFSDSAAR